MDAEGLDSKESIIQENIELKKQLTNIEEFIAQIAFTKVSPTIEEKEKFPNLKVGFYQNTYSKDGIGTKPDYNGMADYLNETFHIISHQSYAYYWENNQYKYLDYKHLRSLILTIGNGNVKPNHTDNFAKHTLDRAYNKHMLLKEADGLINCKNGILNIKTRNLISHNPKYFFKYILKHNYDSQAKAPEFEKFLKSVFETNPECIDITAELFGYCLLGNDPLFHKVFVLLGKGRNGKGTWQQILEALLGEENVSHLKLSQLDKPFSTVNLDGKLANISGETPNEKINAEILKTASSGEYIQAAHKGKPEYEFKCKARFIFACNEMPTFTETSVGLRERLFFIPFNKYIEESERDTNLANRIIFNEMSGILNFALDGLDRLLKRGHLPASIGHQETMEEFHIASDSVYDWFEDRVTYDDKMNELIPKERVYEFYKTYCDNTGRKPCNMNTFSKRLIWHIKSTYGIEIQTIRPRTMGQRFRGYKGLIINDIYSQ